MLVQFSPPADQRRLHGHDRRPHDLRRLFQGLIEGNLAIQLQLIFLAAVIAPLVEEIMFRGVLYRQLREATAIGGRVPSVVFSAVLSSFIFAVIHPQGMLAVPVLMALACNFVLAREWRGTLIPSMVAHGLNNGLVLMEVSPFWQQVEQYVSEHSDLQFSHGICPPCYERLAGEL